MTSSYQRRERDICYLSQCVSELENITTELGRTLLKNNIKIPIIPVGGIKETDFITPYNSGHFGLGLTFREVKND